MTGTRHDERHSHPSFGFIRASRVSGHRTMFDSVLNHQHFVTIEIGHAEQEIRYGQSYVHGGLRGKIVSIDMSESQFAQFITSMNVGSGSPCTLSYVNGERIPDAPIDANTRESHERKVAEDMQAVVDNLGTSIAAIEALIAKGKAGKGELQSALATVTLLKQELTSNIPFMMRQFQERMEKIVDRAKIDVNAHAVMMGQRLSMVGNGEHEMPQLTIEEERAKEPT